MTTMRKIQNDRFLRALKRQDVDRTPIWIMRQAGRYLPEYRAARKRAGSFLKLCQTPELACEVTLQPLQRYELDAAIIFSDILVIPDAMGLGLKMVESVGPVFERPINRPSDISRLGVPDPADNLGYVMDAVRLTHESLDGSVPLIGFAGSPWTLAVYMVEGKSKTQFKKILAFAKEHESHLHRLLEVLSVSVSSYLAAKARSGVSALMVFDTWGGILNTDSYLRLSLQYMIKIVHSVSAEAPQIPIILFTKGGGKWLEQIAASGCDAVGLDWNTDMRDARTRVGHKVALQGNLDPQSLKLSNQEIRDQTRHILQRFGHHPGHIFNLGHGITPDIDPEKVDVLVNAVHKFSAQYH